MPRGNGGTSSRFRPTHGNSSNASKSPTWTKSRESLRPFPSGREIRRATRGQQSRLPRRFTTICDCSTRAPDTLSACTAARKSAGTRSTKSPSACWPFPRDVDFMCCINWSSRPNQPLRRHTRIAANEAEKIARFPAPDVIRQTLVGLRKRGFNRLYQAGRVFEFSTPEELLDVDFAKPVYVLVDRLALSPEIRSRLMDSIEICYREGRGEAILEFVPDDFRRQNCRTGEDDLQRALRVQEMRDSLSRAGAAAFLVQQSLWGVPAMPGLWQHGRFRSRPSGSRQGEIARRWRDRAVDQASLQAARDWICASTRARKASPFDVPFRDLTQRNATPFSTATARKNFPA